MSNLLKQAGTTMLEVVISMFIMSVGLLGLAGLQSNAIKDSLNTARQSQTAWLVSELAERIRVNPGGQASDYNTKLTRENCSKPAKLCSNTPSGECTPAEMAAFDIWDVFCGEASQEVLADSVESLRLSTLSIFCDKDCSTPEVNFNVSMSWQIQSVNSQRADIETQQIVMKIRP